MTTSTNHLLSFVLLAFLGASSHAASPSDTAAKITRVIDGSGIAHVARQLQPIILNSYDVPMPGVPDNVRLGLRDAASQSFQADPIIVKVRAKLSTALTGRHLDETLVWLDSPLGRRFTEVENAAANPGIASQIEAYGREIEKRPPSKGRSDLITKLIVASGTTELNAHLIESTVLATALGINAAQPAQSRAPVDLVRKNVKGAMPGLLKNSEQSTRLNMLYTYRDVPDREVESYIKFLQSPSGIAYVKAAVGGMREALDEALGRYMQAIPKSLAKHGHSVGV